MYLDFHKGNIFVTEQKLNINLLNYVKTITIYFIPNAGFLRVDIYLWVSI
jgi:hypothetical protein